MRLHWHTLLLSRSKGGLMPETFWYRAHGLSIRSNLQLPEFYSGSDGLADLIIELSAASDVGTTASLQEEQGAWCLTIPDVGRFRAIRGEHLLIQPDPAADQELLRLYVIGSGLGMLLHQRRDYILHAAAVIYNEMARVVVGEAGAGKSTLAAALGTSGHQVLADDTLVLRPVDSGFVCWPGAAVFKLWQDTLDHLGQQGEKPISGRYQKFFVRNVAPAADAPAPIANIIELCDGPLRLEHLGGAEALRVVTEHTYRPEFLAVMGNREDHFRQAAALTAATRIMRLSRPRDLSAIPDVVRLLETSWNTE